MDLSQGTNSKSVMQQLTNILASENTLSDSGLLHAMQAVARQLVDCEEEESMHQYQESQQVDSPMTFVSHHCESMESDNRSQFDKTITSEDFKNKTIERMNTIATRKSERLEQKRKELLTDEISQLQEKPQINKNSAKLHSYKRVPLYKRVGKILNDKEKMINELKLENKLRQEVEEKQTCTFQPNTLKSSGRSHREFRESALGWQKKKDHNRQQLVFEKEVSELQQTRSKPKINKVSSRLARSRSPTPTPVVDRLHLTERNHRPMEPSSDQHNFQPRINPKSRKIAKRDQSPIHERLYQIRRTPPPSSGKRTPSRSPTPRSTTPQTTRPLPIPQTGYRINT